MSDDKLTWKELACRVPLAQSLLDCQPVYGKVSIPMPEVKPWVVVLDPGHGQYRRRNFDKPGHAGPLSNDPGASIPGHPDFYERDLVDITAARSAVALHAQNKKHGGTFIDVILTRQIKLDSPYLSDLKPDERRYLENLNKRSHDVLPDMYDTRIEAGKPYQKVLHLSIHADTHPAPKAKEGEKPQPAPQGVGLYTFMYAKPNNPSERWARAIQEGFEEKGLMTTLSYGKASGFAPIRDEKGAVVHGLARFEKQIVAPGPSAGHKYPGIGDVRTGLGDAIGGVVYEAGNVQNPKDLARMLSPKGGREAATILADGITDFISERNLDVLVPALQANANPKGRGR